MRILWLMTRYWPAVGGAETHSRQLIQALAARGHEITVVTHWDENRTDWLRGVTIGAPGKTHFYFDGPVRAVRLGYGAWTAPRRLRTVIPAATYYARQREAADALARPLAADILRICGDQWDIVHGVRIGREPLYVAGYAIARQLGVPFIFTPLHHPRWEGWRYRAYLDLYRRADTLVALTPSEARTYERLGVPSARIATQGIGPVLPNKASGEIFRASHNIRGPLVLFLGQKYPYKGWRQLLDAAPAVWRQYPDTAFAFLGPRTDASRRVFASIHDRRIIELDAVDLQDKGDALAACDIFCLPSDQESFGGVFTEAWSYGKPVIGGAIPAIADVITDGVDGKLVAPRDTTELAETIAALLANPEQAREMGLRGQAKVAERYTWPQIADEVEAIYRDTQARLKESSDD